MAFCPRSAQKIFWWLKSASRATVLRSCSTICVYSRLSSPSFRMSLRFVKIRQGSLPTMQEIELKVWPESTSNHVAYECSSPTKVCVASLLALRMCTCTPTWPSKTISTDDKLAPGKINLQCVISRNLPQWIPRALGAQVINDLSPALNTISPTYCFTHSCAGVHLITLMTLAFVASFQIDANLTTDPRIQTLVDICKGGRECWSVYKNKAATDHYGNCMKWHFGKENSSKSSYSSTEEQTQTCFQSFIWTV